MPTIEYEGMDTKTLSILFLCITISGEMSLFTTKTISTEMSRTHWETILIVRELHTFRCLEKLLWDKTKTIPSPWTRSSFRFRSFLTRRIVFLLNWGETREKITLFQLKYKKGIAYSFDSDFIAKKSVSANPTKR